MAKRRQDIAKRRTGRRAAALGKAAPTSPACRAGGGLGTAAGLVGELDVEDGAGRAAYCWRIVYWDRLYHVRGRTERENRIKAAYGQDYVRLFCGDSAWARWVDGQRKAILRAGGPELYGVAVLCLLDRGRDRRAMGAWIDHLGLPASLETIAEAVGVAVDRLGAAFRVLSGPRIHFVERVPWHAVEASIARPGSNDDGRAPFGADASAPPPAGWRENPQGRGQAADTREPEGGACAHGGGCGPPGSFGTGPPGGGGPSREIAAAPGTPGNPCQKISGNAETEGAREPGKEPDQEQETDTRPVGLGKSAAPREQEEVGRRAEPDAGAPRARARAGEGGQGQSQAEAEEPAEAAAEGAAETDACGSVGDETSTYVVDGQGASVEPGPTRPPRPTEPTEADPGQAWGRIVPAVARRPNEMRMMLYSILYDTEAKRQEGARQGGDDGRPITMRSFEAKECGALSAAWGRAIGGRDEAAIAMLHAWVMKHAHKQSRRSGRIVKTRGALLLVELRKKLAAMGRGQTQSV